LGIIGFIISLIAAFFMLIGLMPFLGWINWFTTLPAAIVGVIISSIAVAQLKRELAGRIRHQHLSNLYRTG